MIKYTFTINNLLICLHTPTSDLQKENIKKTTKQTNNTKEQNTHLLYTVAQYIRLHIL